MTGFITEDGDEKWLVLNPRAADQEGLGAGVRVGSAWGEGGGTRLVRGPVTETQTSVPLFGSMPKGNLSGPWSEPRAAVWRVLSFCLQGSAPGRRHDGGPPLVSTRQADHGEASGEQTLRTGASHLSSSPALPSPPFPAFPSPPLPLHP